MKTKIVTSMLLVLACTSEAHAANFAVATSPPTLLNILILLFAGACLAVCLQLVSLVKGGLFSKIWHLFTVGFALLLLSQLASLLNVFEILLVPSFVVPALLAAMTGAFLFGAFEAKRVLS